MCNKGAYKITHLNMWAITSQYLMCHPANREKIIWNVLNTYHPKRPSHGLTTHACKLLHILFSINCPACFCSLHLGPFMAATYTPAITLKLLLKVSTLISPFFHFKSNILECRATTIKHVLLFYYLETKLYNITTIYAVAPCRKQSGKSCTSVNNTPVHMQWRDLCFPFVQNKQK